MTDKQHKYLLLTAVVPSSICFLAAFLPIFVFLFGGLPKNTFFLFLSSVFGCIGHLGLISLYRNIFNDKTTINFIRLTCGLVSYIILFFLSDFSVSVRSLVPNDIWDFIVLVFSVLILFVYVFYVVLLSKKLIQENN